MSILVENTLNEIQIAGGINSNKPAVFGALVTFNGGTLNTIASASGHGSTAAINTTATVTAAQLQTGYLTSTSAAAVTMTLPTGTLLGTQLGASQGTIFRFYVDNTAGANTVTIAPAVNGIVSSAGVSNAASFGLLTITSGVTGVGEFTIMFSSATAYVFSRTG